MRLVVDLIDDFFIPDYDDEEAQEGSTEIENEN